MKNKSFILWFDKIAFISLKILYIFSYLIFLILGVILTVFFNVTFALKGIFGVHIAILLSFLTLKLIWLAFRRKLSNLFSKKLVVQGIIYFAILELGIAFLLPAVSAIPEFILVKANFIEKSDDDACSKNTIVNVAKDIFEESIDYSKIKIIEGGAPRTLFLVNPNIRFMLTHESTIYLTKECTWDNSLFIHEMTHVLQYQRNKFYGLQVAFNSLVDFFMIAVDFDNFIPDAKYNYGGEKGLARAREYNKVFSDFNSEQQAEIVRNYYLAVINDCCDIRGDTLTPEYVRLLRYFYLQALKM